MIFIRFIVGVIVMTLAAVALVGIIFISSAFHEAAGLFTALVVCYVVGWAVLERKIYDE
jgi:hypothetical protein